jgi:thioredoxin reductase
MQECDVVVVGGGPAGLSAALVLLRARRILVATGLRDELPDIPGVRERWGRDLLHGTPPTAIRRSLGRDKGAVLGC